MPTVHLLRETDDGYEELDYDGYEPVECDEWELVDYFVVANAEEVAFPSTDETPRIDALRIEYERGSDLVVPESLTIDLDESVELPPRSPVRGDAQPVFEAGNITLSIDEV